MHDQFADQTVVIGRNGIPLIKRAVHAHPKPAWRVVLCHRARAWRECGHAFRVDPALDGMSRYDQIVLGERHRFTRSNTDLLLNQVNAEDFLGNRMFDLKPGVHLDEIKLAIFIQKFDGSGTDIVHVANGFGTDTADPGPGFGVNHRRRRFFENLLVATLQGTIPFAQMHTVALAIAEHLHLDVARASEVFFYIDCIITKCRFRL